MLRSTRLQRPAKRQPEKGLLVASRQEALQLKYVR